MRIRAATPAEFEEAVGLLHIGQAEGVRQHRNEAILGLLHNHSIPAEGLLVAHDGSHLVGAVLATPSPGHVGLLRPPGTLRPDLDLEDRLVRAALDWLGSQGCFLVQSLAPPAEIERYHCLIRQGFLNPCRLWYLGHPLDPLPSPRLDVPAFTLLPFPQVRQRFEATLLATYADSLDFPELAGQRSLEDILEGHRAGTLHDPDRWWLIEQQGQDAGIVMVGLLPDTGEWDLSYLGLVPGVRGRGLGRAVLEVILHRAHRLGIPRVLVAVDERNLPAWRLYRSLGFLPDEAREVFLKLPAPSADTPLPPHAPVL